MRILAPAPTLKTIQIVAGPKSIQVVKGEIFDKVPYEDPQKQTVTAGYVLVPQGELEPGVYQVASTVTDKTAGGNDLVRLVRAEWPRHNHT